ncbi:MAG TPA: Rid family hydrolase [Reyranellaceae bacterium]|nr:Rid family hydrolase [Reyranellaceae bacterium]
MANKFHNPKSVALAGKYALGCEVPGGSRLLFVSGQVGLDSGGKLADGIEAQCEQTWKNIGEVLKSGGMDYADIVKMTTFLTDSRFIEINRNVRNKYIKEPYTASTLLIVQGLADPAMLVEIEVTAAK